ncbi:MAG: hypothetical protein ABSB99_10545 [Acidimicrobiales bacterium]|jgi:predicted lysophospholipase L1 biosynthesis ABC-type transport system permease subunit
MAPAQQAPPGAWTKRDCASHGQGHRTHRRLLRPRQHQFAATLGLGAVVGHLLGRTHHPLVWATLAMGLLLVSTLVLALWPWFLGAGALVIVSRLHARG